MWWSEVSNAPCARELTPDSRAAEKRIGIGKDAEQMPGDGSMLGPSWRNAAFSTEPSERASCCSVYRQRLLGKWEQHRLSQTPKAKVRLPGPSQEHAWVRNARQWRCICTLGQFPEEEIPDMLHLLISSIVKLYVSEECMHMCVQVPMESRRQHQIPWGYLRFWAGRFGCWEPPSHLCSPQI